ncbi:conserved hypothetical protein [Culex quinquefasciatus]|uniref:Cytohesin Ubiquitin Protein Inducing domain-containing protein n=1 Tax=Culex quinquefasciatus TaxID=7176 RepID=B0WCR1_CULQU|nr:conserved hypothetical protein [Culex quinquefasciatus]|eukprot:XP_001846495.1 conserved hypothetical protein [Culex quinquefasciatus]
MGDAKVKQPYFGTPPHQQATTSKAGLVVSPTTMIDTLKPSGKDDAASKSPTKYELLKARKAELEKRLNENSGVGSQDQNGAAPTLRRKIGTSFKLPENLLNNKEDDINKLLLEKQIQQQISEASLRFANDTSQPKSVRRTHKQNYESAQQNFSGIMSYDLSGAAIDPAKMSPVSSNSSHHHHQHPHQHYQPQQQPQPQSGANRLNKLMQQQQMQSYSPPPGHHQHGSSPGYVLSPPASASSNTVGQAFVYDTKMISRFQAPPPPPPPAPASTGQGAQNDQGYGSSIPPNSNSYDSQQEMTTSGLGGYWMMLETGEKVWCSVDSRFSSLDRKQGGGSMKISRSKLSQYPHAAPIKSNSMGNFDFINKQQQQQLEDSIQPDAISVTSASSENKKREKVWRETSLDSPVVKHRTVPSPSPGMMSNPPPLPAYPQPPPPPPSSQHVQQQAHLQTPLHVNTSHNYGVSPSSPLLLSPQQMRYYHQRQEQQRQRIKQLEEQKQHAYMLEQQQQQHQRLLQQKHLRSPPQLPKHQHNNYSQQSQPASQQHLDLLPQSPRFYDHENHNLPPHYYQSQEHPSQNNLSARHPDLLISPTLSASSSNTLTSPTLRPYSSVSPTPSTITTTSTAAIIHATPDIQTESPKNVTIVQQGKIMPYKEVTKPFEMSDFYKYSTKFKEKKQQQQQQQHHHHQGQHHQMHQHQFHHPQQQQQQQLADPLSPNGNSMGPNGELMQRAVYQPPNPSICRPINYN